MSAPMATSSETDELLTTERYPLLLFYDSDCSFCNRWVARVKAADHAHRTRFSIIQGKTFERVKGLHPRLGRVDSVVLIERRPDGREDFFIRSTAIRKLIDGLPGFRLFAWVLHLVPTLISDLGYVIFSKLRTPLFGKWHGCRVPIEQDRELYLD